ncbi:MAG: DUF2490 domain-containing protein [Tannerellaceae bacterium]|nr:DUF2490 domain-containing protein [Tannerellaceae bacterium]
MRIKTLFIAISAHLVCFTGIAQDQADKQDVGTWTNVTIASKLIAGKWKTWYSLEYKSKENLRELDTSSAMFKFHYLINNHVSIGMGYEFFLKNAGNGELTHRHRYFPEGMLSYTINRFSFIFRSRLMNTFLQWIHPYFEHRNMLRVSYTLEKIPVKPFISAEPYHEIVEKKYRFYKGRYAVGGSYIFKKRHQLDLYYMQEFFHTIPFTRHVIGIDYIYSL